jgi:hypothetical protein
MSAKEIQAYAQARQKLTNFGDEQTIDAAALLATFTQIKGANFPAALEAIQNQAATTGASLQTAAMQIGKALNDPIRGVGQLSKVGIQFSKEQRDMIANFVETNQLAAAQAVVLDELKLEFGGVAEAMANPITQAKNAFGDLTEQVGMTFVTLAGSLLQAFDFGAVLEQVTKFAELVRTVLTPLAPILATITKMVAILGAAWLALKLAVMGYAVAQRAATAAAIFFRVITNPAGMLAIALSIGVATVAIREMNGALDETAEAASEAASAVENLSVAGSAVQGIADAFAKFKPAQTFDQQTVGLSATLAPGTDDAENQAKAREAMKRIAQARALESQIGKDKTDRRQKSMVGIVDEITRFAVVATEAQKKTAALRETLTELERLRPHLGADQAAKFSTNLKSSIAAASGVTDQIQKANEQARLMTGAVTDTQLALEAVAANGALPEQIADLQVALREVEQARVGQQVGEQMRAIGEELAIASGKATQFSMQLDALAQAGASPEQLQRLQSLNAELEKMQAASKLRERGAQLAESLRTPVEQFGSQLAEFQRLFDAGAIDQQTFDRAEVDASKKFLSGRSSDAGGAAALARGSREAFSRILQAGRQSGGNDPVKVAKAQLGEAQKQTASLAKLAANPSFTLEEVDI